MNYKRIQEFPNEDSSEDYLPITKKLRVENEQFLNFNDPPSLVFNKLKIPRRAGNEISTYTPLVTDTVSLIPPPFPGFEETFRNVDDPVTKAVIDNITGKLPTKAPKLNYYRCKECELSLSGQATLDAHLAGARHKRKLKELELSYSAIGSLKREKIKTLGENKFRCKLCDVNAESLVMIKSHIDGSKHKKKLQAYRDQKSKKHATAEISPIQNDNTSSNTLQAEKCSTIKIPENLNNKKSTTGTADSSKSFYCHICNVSMNSQQQYDQHINSKKHSSKVAKLGNTMNENIPKTS